MFIFVFLRFLFSRGFYWKWYTCGNGLNGTQNIRTFVHCTFIRIFWLCILGIVRNKPIGRYFGITDTTLPESYTPKKKKTINIISCFQSYFSRTEDSASEFQSESPGFETRTVSQWMFVLSLLTFRKFPFPVFYICKIQFKFLFIIIFSFTLFFLPRPLQKMIYVPKWHEWYVKYTYKQRFMYSW